MQKLQLSFLETLKFSGIQFGVVHMDIFWNSRFCSSFEVFPLVLQEFDNNKHLLTYCGMDAEKDSDRSSDILTDRSQLYYITAILDVKMSD